MARLALIAAALGLLLGACGVKSDEELLEPLLGDIEVSFATTSAPPAASSGSSATTTGDDGSTSTSDRDGTTTTTTTDETTEPPQGGEPGHLGDDPALDQLAAQCFDGDLDACDDLYFESPLGSEYERYGSTCGDRNEETSGGCTVQYAGEDTAAGDTPPGEAPGDLGDDPALDDLAQRCFEGEMQACDHLYFQSPRGSDHETYGATCGGRNEEAGGSCLGTYGAG